MFQVKNSKILSSVVSYVDFLENVEHLVFKDQCRQFEGHIIRKIIYVTGDARFWEN